MDNQKEKITNLTIYEGSNKKHILEARYTTGRIIAIKSTKDPQQIRSLIKIIKASNQNIWVASFLPSYDDIVSTHPGGLNPRNKF